MTTIIGLEFDDHCVIAADSATTCGDRTFISQRQPKIVEVDGLLIACAGLSVACDAVMHTWKPPAHRDKESNYRHIVASVVPSIRMHLAARDITFKDDDGFQILLAYDGVLHQIESDFSVLLRDDGMYAIGSGAAYAIGALDIGATFEEAIEVAARHDIYTSGPTISRSQQRA